MIGRAHGWSCFINETRACARPSITLWLMRNFIYGVTRPGTNFPGIRGASAPPRNSLDPLRLKILIPRDIAADSKQSGSTEFYSLTVLEKFPPLCRYRRQRLRCALLSTRRLWDPPGDVFESIRSICLRSNRSIWNRMVRTSSKQDIFRLARWNLEIIQRRWRYFRWSRWEYASWWHFWV